MRDAIEQFRVAIKAAGLHPPEVIEPDGKIHRFSSNANPGDDAGWYVLHNDTTPGGVFGDWRTGLSQTWRADIGRELSSEEKRARRARIDSMRREHQMDAERRNSEARENAAVIWQQAARAQDDHPYLLRKGIQAHGLRLYEGALVAPMRDASGELHSLQFIAGDGEKRFLAGGRVNACCFAIGKPEGVLCIAEGYATGASIHEATGCAVAVAFMAGNLLPVAQALREKFPELRLIVCADDDAGTLGNPGLTKAREAALAVDAFLTRPDFGARRPAGATDFNDLHAQAGLAAVRAGIERAAPVEVGAAATATVAITATEWQEPQPLDRKAAQPEPYPVDALPGAIGAAVREYQAYGQQPMALVGSSALAVVSLAAQGLADVARDERLHGPLSLNFLVVASSGERKTSADKMLGAVLGTWEHERRDALSDEIKRSSAALDAWAAEHEGLKGAIKAAVRKKPEDAANLRRQLIEHALDKPVQIIAPRLRYEDVNPQSLAFLLAGGHPSAALWSDEGGMVTGSLGMGKESLLGFMSSLNRLWDGGAIHHDRKQAPSVHLEGRRLTVSLMVQPMVLRELAQRGGGLTRGSGFLARYLVAAPRSTMGERLYQKAPQGMPNLAAFHQRIRELLDSPLPLDDQDRLALPVLKLSAGAFALWRDYHDAIEREMKSLGEYTTVCDFAAKSAENAARIAGCLQIFEGAQGAIPHEMMERGVALARWYLREALRMLDVLDEPQAWADARLLDAWLAESGDRPLRDVLRLGPSPLRDKARRNAAVDVLAELGRAHIEHDGRREILVRNPALTGLATATRATFATQEDPESERVAQVASVAVAEGDNSTIERGEL